MAPETRNNPNENNENDNAKLRALAQALWVSPEKAWLTDSRLWNSELWKKAWWAYDYVSPQNYPNWQLNWPRQSWLSWSENYNKAQEWYRKNAISALETLCSWQYTWDIKWLLRNISKCSLTDSTPVSLSMHERQNLVNNLTKNWSIPPNVKSDFINQLSSTQITLWRLAWALKSLNT